MTKISCEVEVNKVTTTEEPEKNDLISVTLSGMLTLTSLTDIPAEFTPVKIVLKGVSQRMLLDFNGIGKNGDRKLFVLEETPQTKFETE